LKVIHVVHGKANPREHNGISRVVYYLNKFEKLSGCDSQIWAIVDGARSHFTHRRDEFVTVECFPRVWTPWGKHEIIEELVKNKGSIDLVHFHLIWFYDKNIIAAALKKAGIPFIITTHGTYSTPHAYTGKRLLARWLFERHYLNMADEVHAITREEGSGLQTYGYVGPSFVVHNGVDLDEIPERRSTTYFDDKPYRDKSKLVWVGVLREDKNLRSLIAAVAMLPHGLRGRFVCVLVGPDYKGNAARYLALARDLGCSDNFDYVGPLYGQAKYDAIESCDAFVLPSFTEALSLAMLDAMACGKPCLATSRCGYDSFVQEDFYVRCEPYPQDLARGLEQLLVRRADWPLMGRNARRMVERHFTWVTIADVMLEHYARIASDGR
jgi:glycosyltransferase involved in cell wall biosynthesis